MSVFVDNNAEDRLVDIQEMTFTRWCNNTLSGCGSSLIDDIFNGRFCLKTTMVVMVVKFIKKV